MFPLTILRKGQRKFTYVGMLIETTREKIIQGGPALVFHLLEYCSDSMVLQEAGYNRDVFVWGGMCDHEGFHGDPPRDKV